MILCMIISIGVDYVTIREQKNIEHLLISRITDCLSLTPDNGLGRYSIAVEMIDALAKICVMPTED